ncbi:zinc-binding dehydrogenase [Aurantimonas coralicida]|jgi:alcohol dehydrogenase|uniref:zinc-binding dehydrogenase n=1 Tax=Aurantimonas coralicida TaxID=182270 RepID=UPI001E31FE6D|nr:zinc-binding dehydrogenase [Aurantimonas coralicida]MCD1641964.1 zinc-binding dehydrogenase [Aurantimonas coralicida]
MRALQLVGDRELKQVDLPPPPPPGPGEVTVDIAAVALNHIDVWGWRGMAFAKRKMPLVVGAEASGVVSAIGPGVASVLPGQLVAIYGAQTCGLCRPCREGRDNLCEHVSGVHGFHLDGFAQEKVNLPARLLVPAPPGCDAIGAALAPVTFGTVEHMLFDNAKLEPGETILVHAGGSGIGSAAIQLAKRHGATVITTVGSDDKAERARALGADHVINYRVDRFEGVTRKLTKKKGVDVVFEHVGADTWAGSMLCMKRGGRLVTCGSTSGVSTQMNLMQLFQQQLKLFGSFGCRMENMRDAMQKMARGIVHPVIDAEIGFDQIDIALKRMEAREVFGKIVLRVADEAGTESVNPRAA